MGDISLSLFGKANLDIDSVRIIKDKLIVDVSDLNLMMPYSVLQKNPADWMKKIKIEVLADEISVNNRQLLIKKFKSDLLKEESIIKLKNTEFNVFDGKGKSYLEMDVSQGLKANFEMEVRDGKWPIEKLRDELKNKSQGIPQADQMISKIDIDENFEKLTAKVLVQNGITNIQEVFMNVPKSKADVRATGVINEKSALNMQGSFIIPLDNVPRELKSADGRGKIPFDIIGTVDNPKVNWER